MPAICLSANSSGVCCAPRARVDPAVQANHKHCQLPPSIFRWAATHARMPHAAADPRGADGLDVGALALPGEESDRLNTRFLFEGADVRPALPPPLPGLCRAAHTQDFCATFCYVARWTIDGYRGLTQAVTAGDETTGVTCSFQEAFESRWCAPAPGWRGASSTGLTPMPPQAGARPLGRSEGPVLVRLPMRV